jgi:hypothetical protein
MSPSPLQNVVESVKDMLIKARADGKLTAAELLTITIETVKQIHAIHEISQEEKKGIVLLALQKGLSAAGPLEGFAHVDPALIAELEKQALHMAVNSAFGLLYSSPQFFAHVEGGLSSLMKSLSVCLPACFPVAAATSVVDPVDSQLVQQGAEALKKVTQPVALQVRTPETILESVAATHRVPAAPVAVAKAASAVQV